MVTRTPTTSKPLTLSQRSAAAVAGAAQHLGLTDQKIVATVLVELAAEQVLASASFARQASARYSDLQPKPREPRAAKVASTHPRTQSGEPTAKPRISARRTPGQHVNLAATLDPRTLVPLYGNNLPNHLQEYSPQALSEMARVLVPGAGEKIPPQKSGKPALIAYILRHVTG